METGLNLLHLGGREASRRQKLEQNVFWRRLREKTVDTDSAINEEFGNSRLHRGVEEALGISHPAGCQSDVLRSGGIDLLKQRQHFEPNLITHHIRDEVGSVDHVLLPKGIKVLENVGTADAEQRTHDVTVSRTDARQPVNACTANEVHQQRLDGIVAMVGNTNLTCTDILSQLLKVLVSKLAGSHLNAYLMNFGVIICCEMTYMKWNAPLLAKRNHELLIAVGLCSTKMEIAVDGLYLIAKTLENEQQSNAVGPAADCHEVAGIGRQQLLGGDELADNLFDMMNVSVSHLTIRRRGPTLSGIHLQDGRY